MALPTLEKTYEFSVNELHGGVDSETDHHEVLFRIKQAITSYVNNPWTVHSSSNQSVAGAGDNWNSVADLNWAGSGAFSWIVFNAPTGGQVMWFLVSFEASRAMGCYYSPGGLYTGGTTTVAPTAPDNIVVFGASTRWLQGNTGAANYRLHFIHSTDGENSFVVGHTANTCRFFMGNMKVQNPVSGWSYPWIFHMGSGQSVDRLSYNRMRAQQLWLSRTASGGADVLAGLTCEGWLSNSVGENIIVPHDIDGSWPMLPIGVASTSSSARGRYGRVADLWYTSTGVNQGDTLEAVPASPTREFAAFDDLVFPWNGTVPLIA